MHTRTKIFAVIAVLVLGVGPAVAGKVGYVEVERAVATVDQGKAQLEKLTEWAEPRRERVESLRQEVEDVRSQLNNRRAVASAEALERLKQDEIQARRKFEDAARSFERDYEKKQNELLRNVARRLNAVISDYARANGFDSVVIFKPNTIIYLSDEVDLTDTVIQRYNEQFPAQEN